MKPPEPKPGRITKALEAALVRRRQLLDDGLPTHEVDRLVGQDLKAVLGNTRPEPWKFYCAICRDTGWINVDPSPQEFERLRTLYGDNPQYQGYVAACEPCPWRQMEREKRRKVQGLEGVEEEDFVTAGQTKRGGFRKLTR